MNHIELESFQHELEMPLIKAELTIIDRRNGKVESREFTRMGRRFPIEAVGKELGKYGYDILGFTEEEPVDAHLDLTAMYEAVKYAEMSVA